MALAVTWIVGLAFRGGPEGAARELERTARAVWREPGRAALVGLAALTPVSIGAWARFADLRLSRRAAAGGAGCLLGFLLLTLVDHVPHPVANAVGIVLLGIAGTLGVALGERLALRGLRRLRGAEDA
jgi:hypothetical protein